MSEQGAAVPLGGEMQSTEQPFLELRGISKRYGSVTALKDVSLQITRGQVLALVGDNGAGKSTLVKTISGTLHPDEGRVVIEGRHERLTSPQVASALGIATVYQDLALCENLDVVSNLFLGKEICERPLMGSLRRLSEPEMERRAAEVLQSLGVRLPSLRRSVSAFSGGQRQAIAVSRALLWGSRLVLLDEPTAALGIEQTAQVLDLIRRLAAQGQAVLLVSHSLPDVFSVADRIAVLRLGTNAGIFDRSSTTTDEVVAAMTGGRAGGPRHD
jgi:D-xylose transport system ATP-binding protein